MNKFVKGILVFVLTFFLFIILVGVAANSSNPEISDKQVSEPSIPKSTIVKSSFSGLICKMGTFGGEATGKYTSDGNYNSVFIDSAFLDEKGNVLYTGIGSINNIQKGETKFFKSQSSSLVNFHSCSVQTNGKY